MRTVSLLLSLAVTGFGQSTPNARPVNVAFTQGAVGQIPPGWEMPPIPTAAGFRAELRREGCEGSSLCAGHACRR